MIFLIPGFLKDNFEIIKQACDFKISPSFNTRSLLAFKVWPLEVISQISSAVEFAAIDSVAPLDLIIEKIVTPLEYRYWRVRFAYFEPILINLLLFFLNSSATSSKSNVVKTSIYSSLTASTRFAKPKFSFFSTLIFFWIFISDSFNKSNPLIPISTFPIAICSIISLACKNKTLIFGLSLILPNNSRLL